MKVLNTQYSKSSVSEAHQLSGLEQVPTLHPLLLLMDCSQAALSWCAALGNGGIRHEIQQHTLGNCTFCNSVSKYVFKK